MRRHAGLARPAVDRSPVARATRRRYAALIRRAAATAAGPGVLLATAEIEATSVADLLGAAVALTGPGVGLEEHLLHPGDPLGLLRELFRRLPDTVPAVLLAAHGLAP